MVVGGCWLALVGGWFGGGDGWWCLVGGGV